MRVKSSGFYGGDEDTFIEKFSTKKLIKWALENDSIEYDEKYHNNDEERPDILIGKRTERLLEVADEVGAMYCSNILKKYKEGKWPPTKPAPRIKDVIGVARKSVWRGVSHVFYLVKTNQGDAYVGPVSEDGVSVGHIGSITGSHNSASMFRAKVSKRVQKQMLEFEDQLNKL